MQCVFVQIRCEPGKAYEVAEKIYELEIGKYINTRLLKIPGIARSLTTLTFKAF